MLQNPSKNSWVFHTMGVWCILYPLCNGEVMEICWPIITNIKLHLEDGLQMEVMYNPNYSGSVNGRKLGILKNTNGCTSKCSRS